MRLRINIWNNLFLNRETNTVFYFITYMKRKPFFNHFSILNSFIYLKNKYLHYNYQKLNIKRKKKKWNVIYQNHAIKAKVIILLWIHITIVKMWIFKFFFHLKPKQAHTSIYHFYFKSFAHVLKEIIQNILK